MGPDITGLTPGSVCTNPDSHRYPEKINYCRRDVTTGEKWAVIETYNRKFGYGINAKNRGDFKIDHLIPLCMGGSNEQSNLWPQHKSIYPITDPLEELSCSKMGEGVLKQERAIELIKEVKMDLSKAEEVTEYLESL